MKEKDRKTLFRALATLIEKDVKLRTSGNIESKLSELDMAKRLEVADVVFEKNDPRPIIFSKALALGRIAKEKLVTWVEINGTWYYFIGTEADVLRKLTPVGEEATKTGDKTQTEETSPDLDKQEQAIMDQVTKEANEVLK